MKILTIILIIDILPVLGDECYHNGTMSITCNPECSVDSTGAYAIIENKAFTVDITFYPDDGKLPYCSKEVSIQTNLSLNNINKYQNKPIERSHLTIDFNKQLAGAYTLRADWEGNESITWPFLIYSTYTIDYPSIVKGCEVFSIIIEFPVNSPYNGISFLSPFPELSNASITIYSNPVIFTLFFPISNTYHLTLLLLDKVNLIEIPIHIEIVVQECRSHCPVCSYPCYCLNCDSPYFTVVNGFCCPIGCDSCQKGVCLSCLPNYYYVAIGQMCCPEYCNTCSDSICTECISGYYVVDNTCLPNNCIAINSLSQCIQCQIGYALTSNNTCCPNNCDTCINNACLLCNFGYTYNNNFCCPKYCKECINGTCNSCNDRYDLILGSCCPNNCTICNYYLCNECNQGFYLTSSSQCYSCPEGCIACDSSSNCSECNQGYFLRDYHCVPCSDYCVACISASICTGCQIGYNLASDGSCCSENCTTCAKGKCTSCANGFSLSDYDCCVNNCDECNNGICEKCKNKFKLDQSGFCCSNDCTFCNHGFCCPLHCEVCDFGLCLKCDPPFVLKDGSCKQAKRT